MSRPEPQRLAERLRAYVAKLATEIGECNVFRPHALRAAADCIRRECAVMGYAVAGQRYRAGGVDSQNLEVALPAGQNAARSY